MDETVVTPCDFAQLGDEAETAWLRPVGLLTGAAAAAALERGLALPLAAGPTAFGAVELLARRGAGIVASYAPLARARDWARARAGAAGARIAGQLEALSTGRPAWAGLALDRPLVMGVVNVTPDSFSDGGGFRVPDAAIAHGHALIAEGADIVDIGGESTRPGAAPVAPDEELRRIGPVLSALASAGAVVSVDTRHAAAMAMALAAGARIVNDVTALAGDPASLGTVARSGAAVVLMHMQGEPATMQRAPRYGLASLDVLEYLAARIAACEAAGIARARIVVDPGIGFGKSERHNLEILARLALFHALGVGVMVGVSRKSLIGRLTGAAVGERLPGSLAGALHALGQGVQIVRVHDVAATRQAMAFARAIAAGG
ncbi:MAG TPA: dihydropteroate synthase [Stellaceae bacterium]|nr:dihydropteroate synthase [Stellaceae bacterium]